MKTWTKRQIFTYIALFLLLAVRFPVADFVANFARLFGAAAPSSWLLGLGLVEDSTYYLWDNWSFVLVGLVIIANRSDLYSLNVDAYFVIIFFCSGLAYFRFSFLEPSGWAVALVSVSIILLFRRGEFKFGAPDPSMWRIVSIIGIASFVVLGWSFIRGSLDAKAIGGAIHELLTGLPLLVVEEMIFRGMLWMFLKDLGRSTSMIVVFQAILFWLSHSYFIFTEPIYFWLIIPAAGILFGILVWKTRSITPGTLAHLSINSLWGLIWV